MGDGGFRFLLFRRPKRGGGPGRRPDGRTARVAELRYEYGFTKAEIGAELGLTEGAVKARLRRYDESRRFADA